MSAEAGHNVFARAARPIPGERRCSSEDRGEDVVHHPRARECAGGWFCPECGISSLDRVARVVPMAPPC